jgi:hypothetical protein
MVANIHPEQGDKKGQVSFGKQAQVCREYYANTPERELYYYLINRDEFPSIAPRALQWIEAVFAQTEQKLIRAKNLPSHLRYFPYTPTAFASSMNILQQQRHITSPQSSKKLKTTQLHDILLQYAPITLVDGCWLQDISLASTNHTEVTTRLFRLYAEKIGDGLTNKHYGNLYQDLLRSARLYLPEVNTRLFSTKKNIRDVAFTIPVFQLALSSFPRLYLPEIIGFTLGHFCNPQDRLLITLSDQLQQHGYDNRYCQRYILSEKTGENVLLIQEIVTLYLNDCKDENERQQHWKRIWKGLVVHTVINEHWLKDVHEIINYPRKPTPHDKMVALMHVKVPYARNMHRHQKLGGKLINDWFAQEPFDADACLVALANSPYINIMKPEKSRFITRSIKFGGPMFRIFTLAEQQIITEWIKSLALDPRYAKKDKKTTAEITKPTSPSQTVIPPAPIIPLSLDDVSHPDLATYKTCNKRELYYYLVNADLYPDVLPTARKIARQYFKQATVKMGKRNIDQQLSLFPYSHHAFEARIQLIYETELNAYEAFVPPSTVPREIMVWFIEQYAPFPMVDGSWVQHIARAGMSHTEISAHLFRIYSDEVGNGNIELNHPNVYRKLLDIEGITMPPTDSMAFPMQSKLSNFTFDLSLLTLSTSLFPKAFLAEIIGINLAIELSGLGKGYMQIIDELRYWKMDPYFFSLHLTIDNIVSGHTAMAMETVHLYLDQILATQGEQAVQREWKRIWGGYLAFKENMTRFDTTLEKQAAIRFMIPLIRLKIKNGKNKKRKSIISAG